MATSIDPKIEATIIAAIKAHPNGASLKDIIAGFAQPPARRTAQRWVTELVTVGRLDHMDTMPVLYFIRLAAGARDTRPMADGEGDRANGEEPVAGGAAADDRPLAKVELANASAGGDRDADNATVANSPSTGLATPPRSSPDGREIGLANSPVVGVGQVGPAGDPELAKSTRRVVGQPLAKSDLANSEAAGDGRTTADMAHSTGGLAKLPTVANSVVMANSPSAGLALSSGNSPDGREIGLANSPVVGVGQVGPVANSELAKSTRRVVGHGQPASGAVGQPVAKSDLANSEAAGDGRTTADVANSTTGLAKPPSVANSAVMANSGDDLANSVANSPSTGLAMSSGNSPDGREIGLANSPVVGVGQVGPAGDPELAKSTRRVVGHGQPASGTVGQPVAKSGKSSHRAWHKASAAAPAAGGLTEKQVAKEVTTAIEHPSAWHVGTGVGNLASEWLGRFIPPAWRPALKYVLGGVASAAAIWAYAHAGPVWNSSALWYGLAAVLGVGAAQLAWRGLALARDGRAVDPSSSRSANLSIGSSDHQDIGSSARPVDRSTARPSPRLTPRTWYFIGSGVLAALAVIFGTVPYRRHLANPTDADVQAYLVRQLGSAPVRIVKLVVTPDPLSMDGSRRFNAVVVTTQPLYQPVETEPYLRTHDADAWTKIAAADALLRGPDGERLRAAAGPLPGSDKGQVTSDKKQPAGGDRASSPGSAPSISPSDHPNITRSDEGQVTSAKNGQTAPMPSANGLNSSTPDSWLPTPARITLLKTLIPVATTAPWSGTLEPWRDNKGWNFMPKSKLSAPFNGDPRPAGVAVFAIDEPADVARLQNLVVAYAAYGEKVAAAASEAEEEGEKTLNSQRVTLNAQVGAGSGERASSPMAQNATGGSGGERTSSPVVDSNQTGRDPASAQGYGGQVAHSTSGSPTPLDRSTARPIDQSSAIGGSDEGRVTVGSDEGRVTSDKIQNPTSGAAPVVSHVSPVSSASSFPSQSGAYVLIDGKWLPLPHNNGRFTQTYEQAQLLMKMMGADSPSVDQSSSPSARPLDGSTARPAQVVGALTFDGDEPMPKVSAGNLTLVYIGPRTQPPADALAKYPALRDEPAIELAPLKTGRGNVRSCTLYFVPPGYTDFGAARIAATLETPGDTVTVLHTSDPLKAGRYAVSCGSQSFEIVVQ